jgi:hypothetical protein
MPPGAQALEGFFVLWSRVTSCAALRRGAQLYEIPTKTLEFGNQVLTRA